MAASPHVFHAVPAPTRDETGALGLTEAYSTRAGTCLASRLLARPDLGSDDALDAEYGDALLRAAALCAGLREIADAADRRRGA